MFIYASQLLLYLRYSLLVPNFSISIFYLVIIVLSTMSDRLNKEKAARETLSKINYLGLESFQSSLSDRSTCIAYLQTIKSYAHQIYGKSVLHLTTGCNCLYSIEAARAGAKNVYCVINGHGEIQRKNKFMMQQIIKENGLDHIIKFNEDVEVIIGQPMGYNLIYDGLLDRMIEARDLHLKDVPKSIILPGKIKFKCAFIRDQHFIDKKVQFWDKVYGIPMSSMKHWISHEPMVRFVDPSLIVSEAVKFIQFDISKISYEQMDNIRKTFSIKTPMDVVANGITFWFQLQFRKGDGQRVQVKGSPWCDPTKWTQMTLYGKKLWQLKAGESRKIQFSGKKNHIEGSTVMKIKVDSQDQQIYSFS